MGMRIIAPVVAAVALLSLAAGCGGGNSDGSSTGNEKSGQTMTAQKQTTAISKAAFIKKADSVCAKADKRTSEEFAAYIKENKITSGQTPSTAQYAEIATTILVPALHRQIDEIRSLGAPASDEARIESFLSAVDAATKQAEEEPTEAVKAPRKLLAGADKIIAGYGFKVCG